MNSFQEAIAERINRKRIESYRAGLQDGTEIVLKLLLGIPQYDSAPAPQPIPDDLREWAEQALERAEKERYRQEDQ